MNKFIGKRGGIPKDNFYRLRLKEASDEINLLKLIKVDHDNRDSVLW